MSTTTLHIHPPTQNLDNQHVRILLRHVLIPFLRNTPINARETWALPVLRVLLPHLHARLTDAWATQGAASQEGPLPGGGQQQVDVVVDSAAADEIVKSRLLVELTREAVGLLVLLHEKSTDGMCFICVCMMCMCV